MLVHTQTMKFKPVLQNNFRKFIMVIAATVFIWSCASRYDGIPVADYASGLGFEIIEVDGGEEQRVEHGRLGTDAPFVIVKPGRHILVVQRADRSEGLNLHTIDFVFQEDRKYIIGETDGKPEIQIVE